MTEDIVDIIKQDGRFGVVEGAVAVRRKMEEIWFKEIGDALVEDMKDIKFIDEAKRRGYNLE